jgi:hypothetical protein
VPCSRMGAGAALWCSVGTGQPDLSWISVMTIATAGFALSSISVIGAGLACPGRTRGQPAVVHRTKPRNASWDLRCLVGFGLSGDSGGLLGPCTSPLVVGGSGFALTSPHAGVSCRHDPTSGR